MKVIIAIDDSPYGARVVDSVVDRRWPLDVDFKILTVLEPLCACGDDDVLADFSDTLSAIQERRRRAAQRFGERVRHQIESTVLGARVHCEIREGLPRTEIINAAVDWNADRILVGAHGRDVCPHNMLGSVSRAVVNHAPCTVEIVRTDKHRKKQMSAAATTAAKTK
jgi:nucleotide-binding universal stress UspA family protein